MAIRTILVQGDPALNKMCHPVTKFDDRLSDLLDDLRETLAQANGLGLAAPQVGILRRAVIVVDDKGEMLELVNPEIIEQDGEQDGLEGCLSVPGLWGYVKRPAWVKMKAQDRFGNRFEVEGSGVTARCFCHELSHLDGHLYTEECQKLYTSEELDQMIEEQEEGQ
ncbi:MAG: peptide deformylase [Lawsonibacter sp.]